MTVTDRPLTFVSNSEPKLEEYRILLGLPNLIREPTTEAESTATSLDELVREKCEKASKQHDPPLFVEHTALAIEGLGGLPGVTTQPFSSKISNAKLLTMIEKEKGDGRRAIASIAIGYLQSTGAKVRVIEAQTSGYLSNELRGTSGFGWDDIFVPEGELKTYAEMTSEEKNRTSMRAKVANSFKILLRDFKSTDGAQLSKPVVAGTESHPLDKPPESLPQALLALVWSSKPWLRNVVLGIGFLCFLAFTLWASFPDAMKQRIIDWIVAHSR